MRSALLGVCFALIVHRGGRATTDEDFKPTPIPLNEWSGEKAGPTAQGAATQAGPAAADTPRYWEDALRHSIYLTFVRDKIDQLITKGNALTPDSKLEAHASNDIDDHNLWEKIKSAPFERLNEGELPFKGDIALLAKGRLLDVNGELRFKEDELMKVRCDDKCMQGVKALWSVRRVRQKDTEPFHGKYNYELTFSVNFQSPKKIKKPFDTSVRTFTVRDGTPVEQPSAPLPPHMPRPQRAVWLHKNIIPVRTYQNRNQGQSFDRLFLSLFGSDEEDVPPRPLRPHPYVSSVFGAPQQAKVGHVGSPTEQYQQKKPHFHSHVYKYTRPPLGPPPTVSQAEHHYMESDKLKIPIPPPKVQYEFPEADGMIKMPLAPPPVQLTQHQVDDKINSIYPQVSPQVLPQAHAPVELDHSSTDKNYTPVPFSEEVQRYLDEIAAKHPYNPPAVNSPAVNSPAVQYHYEVTTKVQNIDSQHNTANYQHNIEPEPVTKIPSYIAQPDYRHQPSNVVKTTRPAVLPTPPMGSLGATKNLNLSEITTKEPEIVTVSAFKSYKKHPIHKPQPMKLHFPDHVRPPVFNAPPGVFMPMDKKPFKPMPPLKYHHNYHTHSKHVKTRPIDFRPSPQVVDIQLFSEPDPLSDAFRPMPVSINFTKNTTDSYESSEETNSGKYKGDHHKNVHKLKSTKLEPVVLQQTTTTSIPDIITAQSLPPEDSDSMHWATSLLSALTKISANNDTELTSDEPTTTVTEPISTVTLPTITEVIKEEVKTTTTSPKKRTRPPHKVVKAQKEKKHKRITTTTTTSTSSTTTTEKPRHKRPPPSDLTPQASSAATGTPKPSWQPKQKKQNETAPTTQDTVREDVVTIRPTTTTWPSTTTKLTTTSKPTTTASPEMDYQTTPKNMNRFRISTLLYKGTSVKHDKWSMPVTENNKTKPVHIKPNQQQQRRKGSNFHGYVSSTPKNVDEQHHKQEHKDLAYKVIETTTEMILDVIPVTTEPIQLVESLEDDFEHSSENDEEGEGSDEKGAGKDIVVFYNENLSKNDAASESTEVEELHITKDTTPATVKKSKCKKKKHQNLTTTEAIPLKESWDVEGADKLTTNTTTETEVTLTTEADLFTQIFGGYTVEGLPNANKTLDPEAAGSEHKEQVAELHDDLEDFLDSLENNKSDNDKNYEYEDEDEDDDEDEFSPQDSKVEETRSQRHAHDDISYDDYRDRPYSLLELMAME